MFYSLPSEEISPVGDVGRADRGHYNASQTLNLCLSGQRFHIGNADISYCVSNISSAVGRFHCNTVSVLPGRFHCNTVSVLPGRFHCNTNGVFAFSQGNI